MFQTPYLGPGVPLEDKPVDLVQIFGPTVWPGAVQPEPGCLQYLEGCNQVLHPLGARRSLIVGSQSLTTASRDIEFPGKCYCFVTCVFNVFNYPA